MLKNLHKLFSLLLVGFMLVAPAMALGQEAGSEQETEVIFFYSPTCQHCAAEEVFLDDLVKDYPWIKVQNYEFSKNVPLAQEFYANYNVPPSDQGFVPLTFIRDRYFVGFNDQVGQEMKSFILGQAQDPVAAKKPTLPIIGEVNVENLSFPAIAVIFGFFDGFNVCSLGALVLILSLVLALKSRKRIILFGGLFIVITALVYGLMIFLWHRLFVFVSPFLRNIEIIMGLLAAIGGWLLFKEYLNARKNAAICKFGGITDKMAGRVNEMFEKKAGILAVIGAIILFAVVITVVEFPCSAFFPLLFSGMLADAGISFGTTLLYMGVYIFFYMLDEIIVLLIAAFTMKIWIASPKAMKWLSLAGALMLFVFGFYYLLWPVAKVWFNV